MDPEAFGPLPLCFFLGLLMFSFGAISAAYIHCHRLLPECPVTSIVPLGPIGTCRVNYAYDVLSDHYVGSLVLHDCPKADAVNHTIAVCYDDRNPSLHEASLDADLLFVSEYTRMRVLMWIGAAVIAMASGLILCVCCEQKGSHHPIEVPSAGTPTPTPSGLELTPKLVRSDSAMVL